MVAHTHVVQKSIPSSQLESSPGIFNQEYSAASTPMVLTVEGGASTDCCCCTCKLNVPSGVHILEQHWGKDSGKIRPGVHWCYCCNKRVVYILPIGGIFYDAPVPDCPTRDNVKVSINASMMLKIGSTDLDQRNFIYKLGVTMFDQLLSAEVEEAIRNYIHTFKHDKIMDLKSNLAEALKDDLNARFKSFGVGIEQVNIKDVRMPPIVKEAFMQSTEFHNKIKNEVKKQENEKLMVTNQEDQKLTEIQKQNYKEIEEKKAAIKRAIIEREEDLIHAESVYEVRKKEAETTASVLQTRLEGERRIAENKTQRKVVEIVNRARAAGEAARIELKQKLEAANIEADAQVESTKANCDAIIEEAKAEKTIAQSIQAKRNYQYEMAKAEVLEKLAQSGKVVIAGKTGETLFESIVTALKKEA